MNSPPPLHKPPRLPEPKRQDFPYHWVAIGLAILVIIVLLILLPTIRSNNDNQIAKQPAPAEPVRDQSVDEVESVDDMDKEEMTQSTTPDPQETSATPDTEETNAATDPDEHPQKDAEAESIVDDTNQQIEDKDDKDKDDENEMEAKEDLPSLSDAPEPRLITGRSSQPASESPSSPNRKSKKNKAGLQGRNQQSRKEMAKTGGGTAESELAVDRGIQWLINHQFSDGSWHLHFHQGPCNGRCANPGGLESTTAATGLALMALLGGGHTHKEGPYQQQVQDGLDYLMSQIRESPQGGNLAQGGGRLYSHGIATIALSEAYAMTGDNKLRGPVKEAQKYIAHAQHLEGGWRYGPQQPGDMTVTGWQLMAIKSGELAGIDPPRQVMHNAKQFLESMTNNRGRTFGYQSPGQKPSPTAIGLLMQMYGGTKRNKQELQDGIQFLIQKGPAPNDIYFNYYATLAMHHYGGAEWERWNPKMRDYLIQTQQREGHQEGSWHFPDAHGAAGGRLYNTAMAVMILEVYYRYMPIYNRGN